LNREHVMGRSNFIALGASILLTGGCSVTGGANEVAVEHSAEQFLVAEMAAEEHCAKYGKSAKHVQTSPQTPSVLLLRSRTSIFECVEP